MSEHAGYEALNQTIARLMRYGGLTEEKRLADLSWRNYGLYFPALHAFYERHKAAVEALPHHLGAFTHPLVDPVLYTIVNSFNSTNPHTPESPVYILPFPLPHTSAVVLAASPSPIILVNEYLVLFSELLYHETAAVLRDHQSTVAAYPLDLSSADLSALRELRGKDVSPQYLDSLVEAFCATCYQLHTSLPHAASLDPVFKDYGSVFLKVVQSFDAFRCPACGGDGDFDQHFWDMPWYFRTDGDRGDDAEAFISAYMSGLIRHEEYHIIADHHAGHEDSRFADWVGRSQSRFAIHLWQELDADESLLRRHARFIGSGGVYDPNVLRPLGYLWSYGLPFLIQDYGIRALLGRNLTEFEEYVRMSSMFRGQEHVAHLFSSHPTEAERLWVAQGFGSWIAALEPSTEVGRAALIHLWLLYRGLIATAPKVLEVASRPGMDERLMCRECVKAHPLFSLGETFQRLQRLDRLSDQERAGIESLYQTVTSEGMSSFLNNALLHVPDRVRDLARQRPGGHP